MEKGKIISIDSSRREKENRQYKDKLILTKEKFVEILEKLKTVRDLENQINRLFRENREKIDCEFCDGGGLSISHESTVIELLELLMRDDDKDIEYFVYETDFGRTHKLGDVIENGVVVDLGTAGKLYDYLVQNILE